jgi:hypothetical protein
VHPPESHASSSASSASSHGLQGDLVGQEVGPLLRLGEVLEADHWHVGEPELAGREQPPVTCQDAAFPIN